jgi:hypothetical protein
MLHKTQVSRRRIFGTKSPQNRLLDFKEGGVVKIERAPDVSEMGFKGFRLVEKDLLAGNLETRKLTLLNFLKNERFTDGYERLRRLESETRQSLGVNVCWSMLRQPELIPSEWFVSPQGLRQKIFFDGSIVENIDTGERFTFHLSFHGEIRPGLQWLGFPRLATDLTICR